ncbi:hypothetical protein ACH40E_33380 [Streptomyces acidicola]|uniref:hypothetical protein n=1 Tax=Streptomyces acidicola TaxID=2596892 RepID=UPI0037AE2EAD
MSSTAAAVTVLAMVLGVPAVWCHGWWARGRATAAPAEQDARPPDPHATAIADEIALGLQQLAEACCLPAALTGGDDHDPKHCTRKDHHA